MPDKTKFTADPDKKGRRDETGNSAPGDDLQDSNRDAERLRPDEAVLDLPDVADIPGQENITVPPLGELRDTTACSDDEEDLV